MVKRITITYKPIVVSPQDKKLVANWSQESVSVNIDGFKANPPPNIKIAFDYVDETYLSTPADYVINTFIVAYPHTYTDHPDATDPLRYFDNPSDYVHV